MRFTQDKFSRDTDQANIAGALLDFDSLGREYYVVPWSFEVVILSLDESKCRLLFGRDGFCRRWFANVCGTDGRLRLINLEGASWLILSTNTALILWYTVHLTLHLQALTASRRYHSWYTYRRVSTPAAAEKLQDL